MGTTIAETTSKQSKEMSEENDSNFFQKREYRGKRRWAKQQHLERIPS